MATREKILATPAGWSQRKVPLCYSLETISRPPSRRRKPAMSVTCPGPRSELPQPQSFSVRGEEP